MCRALVGSERSLASVNPVHNHEQDSWLELLDLKHSVTITQKASIDFCWSSSYDKLGFCFLFSVENTTMPLTI